MGFIVVHPDPAIEFRAPPTLIPRGGSPPPWYKSRRAPATCRGSGRKEYHSKEKKSRRDFLLLLETQESFSHHSVVLEAAMAILVISHVAEPAANLAREVEEALAAPRRREHKDVHVRGLPKKIVFIFSQFLLEQGGFGGIAKSCRTRLEAIADGRSKDFNVRSLTKLRFPHTYFLPIFYRGINIISRAFFTLRGESSSSPAGAERTNSREPSTSTAFPQKVIICCSVPF